MEISNCDGIWDFWCCVCRSMNVDTFFEVVKISYCNYKKCAQDIFIAFKILVCVTFLYFCKKKRIFYYKLLLNIIKYMWLYRTYMKLYKKWTITTYLWNVKPWKYSKNALKHLLPRLFYNRWVSVRVPFDLFSISCRTDRSLKAIWEFFRRILNLQAHRTCLGLRFNVESEKYRQIVN